MCRNTAQQLLSSQWMMHTTTAFLIISVRADEAQAPMRLVRTCFDPNKTAYDF